MATTHGPAFLTDAGTVAAMVLFTDWVGILVVGMAGAVDVVDPEVVVGDELLLEHAAPTTARPPRATATTALRIPIREWDTVTSACRRPCGCPTVWHAGH